MTVYDRRFTAAFFVSAFAVVTVALVFLFLAWPVTVQAQTPGCAPLENTVKSFSRNAQFDDVVLLTNIQSVAYFEASYTGVDPAIQVLLVCHVSRRWAALRVFDDEACFATASHCNRRYMSAA